ncbi:MAG: dihydrofolate reductase [Gammaproteobacteria bacterium]|nr:MAG: dihydrofolate reductase [Gammaproteobacteria bacterium]
MKKVNAPILSAIVAMGENRVIGKNNQLPWRLPADLRHFKAITTGHPIIMGRKTYESIGRPLPNRLNIIVTRNRAFEAPGCVVVTSMAEAVQQADGEEAFIIGGAEVYQQAMPLVQRLYLTVVHHVFEGDAYFPALNMAEWREAAREKHEADEENAWACSFVRLEKI